MAAYNHEATHRLEELVSSPPQRSNDLLQEAVELIFLKGANPHIERVFAKALIFFPDNDTLHAAFLKAGVNPEVARKDIDELEKDSSFGHDSTKAARDALVFALLGYVMYTQATIAKRTPNGTPIEMRLADIPPNGASDPRGERDPGGHYAEFKAKRPGNFHQPLRDHRNER